MICFVFFNFSLSGYNHEKYAYSCTIFARHFSIRTVPSAPLKYSVVSTTEGCRWKPAVRPGVCSVVVERAFCNLLNRPLHDPPDVLVAEAEAAIPDADIDTHPHYLGDAQGC